MDRLSFVTCVHAKDDRSISGCSYVLIGSDVNGNTRRCTQEVYNLLPVEAKKEITCIGNLASNACLGARNRQVIEKYLTYFCDDNEIIFEGIF